MDAPLAEFSQPLDALFRALSVPAHVGVQQLVVVRHAADEVPETIIQCILEFMSHKVESVIL